MLTVSTDSVASRPGLGPFSTGRVGWSPVPTRRGKLGDVPPAEPRFLTLADVADVLNVTVRQVRSLLHAGELRGIQIGGRGVWRVENSELERYIERQYAKTEQALADSGLDTVDDLNA